ncbi:MAG: translation initiation factor eIF-1A [Candidatus Helarchaeota archaeon]
MSPKKNKKNKRSKTTSTEHDYVRRVQLPIEGQVLGRVIQILGGGWLKVQCEDDKVRNCRIRGKIRKRMWIRIDDVVLVEPWVDMQSDERGEIITRYTKTQARWLQKKGFLKTGTIEFD